MEPEPSTQQAENTVPRKPNFDEMTFGERGMYAARLMKQNPHHIPLVIQKHPTATFEFGAKKKM